MPPERTPFVSAVIATAFRDTTLVRTLECLHAQSAVPGQIVIVDGAPAPGVEALVTDLGGRLGLNITYLRSSPPSAAVQRNVGVAAATGDIILFLDDDAYLDADCLEKMVAVFERDNSERIGGVGVLIRNQLCPPPSPLAKRWFDFLADERKDSYGGMVIGPAIAVGPEPTSDGRIVRAEWLMSTCAAYRRAALPPGPFESRFYGYSYMEDVDLSVRVARAHELVVDTGAYVFHDSQPSHFKSPRIRARMTVQNRYYVMTRTLGRRTIGHHLKFIASLIVPQLVSLRDVHGLSQLGLWLQSLQGTVVGLCGIVWSTN
jgi:glycogen synthase